jgi:hypothetical protein
MTTTPPRRILLALTLALLAAGLVAGVAGGRMQSERLDRKLCETTGGGRFVKIPGFPGERIDRRLLPDIRMMVRKYDIFITDGYSNDPVHSANGEHPVGLALDIVPDFGSGGNWRKITKLAKWAEPEQNQVRAPFRWVGYNGDAGHGRGNHLHLSWNHVGRMRPGRPLKTVYTIKCPERRDGGNDSPRDGDGGNHHHHGDGGGSGGVGTGGSGGSGGIGPAARIASSDLLRVPAGGSSVETDGVGVGDE